MNTPEKKSRWVEPIEHPLIRQPVALLEPKGSPEIEVRGSGEDGPVFFKPHAPALEDMGGNHLTALDDW